MSFNFDEKVERRNTNCIKWDRYPEDVIPMFIADMDFSVSPAITRRIIERAQNPVYGYSFTDKRLYRAVKDWIREEYDYEVQNDWLEFTGGIVPSLAILSNLTEGKSIANTPNYHMLLNAPEKAGNVMIRVPLRNDNEQYSIDFEALEAAITPEVKLFYLCNPHNPVGRIYTKEELQELSAFAKKHNLTVISDEIHCELVYDRKHTPFYTVDDYARENSITLTAPGKTFNVPGVNFAIAIIPNPELRERFRTLHYGASHPGIFNVEVGIAAYAESKEWKRDLVAYLKSNRDYLETELKKRFPKAKFPHTEGTYLQWVNFQAYREDADAEFFLQNAKIALSDGAPFGEKGYVRLNFACRREVLKEALDRIEKALLQ